MTIEEMAESEPPDAFAVGAFDAGRLIAVGLVGPEGDPGWWRVRGMAAAPAVRGRGAGTAVLTALLDHAREHGAVGVWANVRVAAITLYERAGLGVESEVFELPRIGPHVIMRLRLNGAPSGP